VNVETTKFGTVEIPEEKVILFPRGLLGFAEKRRFFILDYKDTTLKWLQCVDDPDLAFLMMNPFEVFPEYQIDISAVERELLAIEDIRDVAVFCILRVRDDGEQKKVTMNLLGPVVLNSASMRGLQLVMEKARVSAQQEVPVPA